MFMPTLIALRRSVQAERSPVMKRRGRQACIAGRNRALIFTCVAGPILATSNMGAAAAQANTVESVRPAGPGVLTKGFDWLITTSRRRYHHIMLPARIAVGDKFSLSFGSNTKTYTFSVAQIILKGTHCEIFSQSKVDHRRDRIDVVPCYAADQRH
jgi:hypothetical protein